MKITLPQITNGQDLSTLNSNFTAIMSALNTQVLYRVNPIGEDNTINQDIDFNGFRAYNLSDVLVNGVSISSEATVAQAAATQAAASATTAITQAAIATAAAGSASGTLANALIKTNNLSDLSNVTTAKTNLSLDQVNNTTDANKPVSTAQATALDLKANLASPTFTGTVTIPNPVITSNTTVAASTAFVQNNFTTPTFPYGGGTPNGVFATTINSTGLITPTSSVGIKGTIAADNAQSGSIGEYLTVTGTATSISNGVTSAPTSLSLTAGDWDVEAVSVFSLTGTTIISQTFSGLSLSSSSLGSVGSYQNIPGPNSAGVGITVASPIVRINVSTTTTVFAVVNANFSVSTCTVTGFIRARRVR